MDERADVGADVFYEGTRDEDLLLMQKHLSLYAERMVHEKSKKENAFIAESLDRIFRELGEIKSELRARKGENAGDAIQSVAHTLAGVPALAPEERAAEPAEPYTPSEPYEPYEPEEPDEPDERAVSPAVVPLIPYAPSSHSGAHGHVSAAPVSVTSAVPRARRKGTAAGAVITGFVFALMLIVLLAGVALHVWSRYDDRSVFGFWHYYVEATDDPEALPEGALVFARAEPAEILRAEGRYSVSDAERLREAGAFYVPRLGSVMSFVNEQLLFVVSGYILMMGLVLMLKYVIGADET